MACNRSISANKNAWHNDIDAMIGSVKKQMFRVGKCALDLTMAFRKFDLTRPGANPNVKSGLLDATEFNRALADVGIFVSQAECAALVRQFGEGTGEDGFIQVILPYEPHQRLTLLCSVRGVWRVLAGRYQ